MNPLVESRSLQEQIGFSYEDLAANRIGVLSAGQRKRLIKKYGRSGILWWVILGVLILFMLGMLVLVAPEETILALVLLVPALLVLRFWMKGQISLRWEQVSAAEGLPALQVLPPTGSGRTPTYMITVDDHDFQTRDENVYKAFEARHRYCIYFVHIRNKNRILSAEVTVMRREWWES